ncbi:hypothetical protein [Butyrivibrio sp. VCB2006]|uniref:hypothetical protein n=1 Tax=Butyrivibrio sp. VCB2006 TaxID=1280679 RepID=UPI0004924B87|nr:hypothetical protein [Butyrivibrio sp. VCB2006]
MEREYRISRGVIAILTALISYIALINEHISVKIYGIFLFTIVAFLLSFLGTKVSKKMIFIGDKVSNIALRICYYVGLLVAILVLSATFFTVFTSISDYIDTSNMEFAAALSIAIVIVTICCLFFIMLIVPYIQSLIVLIIRRILREKDLGADE